MSEVGIPVDGASTQGENIADNGGMKQAFRAYMKWLSRPEITAEEIKDETLPGFENYTNTQLFFINFAQVKYKKKNNAKAKSFMECSNQGITHISNHSV